MLCAHTVRRLKPGTYEESKQKFGPDPGNRPEGWVAFTMLRSLANPDEVVTFGYFDGTLEELERNQSEQGYDEVRSANDPIVDAEIATGVYDTVPSLTAAG